jgi:oligosaccharide repeat unit polymerase
MKYYLVLAITTAILILLAQRLWTRTRNVSFPMGLALLYYWTLSGAWVLVHDRLANTSNAAYHYSGYEEQLFPILLDGSYFETLLLYALFLILIGGVLLLLVRSPRPNQQRRHAPLLITHWKLLAIASIAGCLSFWIVHGALGTALDRDLSAYEFTRQEFSQSPLFTVHQLLNRIALFAACFGLCVYSSGMKGRFVVSQRRRIVLVGYLAVLGGLLYLMSLLGNRNELVFAGIAVILFYMVNAPRPRLVTALAVFMALIMSISFIYSIRGVSAEDRSQAEEAFDPSGLLNFLQTSNEQFAAHFSLYGVIKQDVPLTYGSSLVSLVASLVPKALWPDRPLSVYYYYAAAIKAAPGEGYTIHHAAGWYLNFGIYGVVLGALLLAALWATLFNWFNEPDGSDLFFQSVKMMAVWTFVASLPALVRAGPEGYKSCLFEAILMPATILALTARQSVSAHQETARVRTPDLQLEHNFLTASFR